MGKPKPDYCWNGLKWQRIPESAYIKENRG